MSKRPTDYVLESLYKLRIRESDQLKTVLELYELEIHQKISKLENHKLKTMAKRNLDQNSGQEISKPEMGELKEEL